MIDLKTLTFLPETLTLWLAPPGAGKTTGLIEYYQSQKLKIIYVSPLRALANEVYERIQDLPGTSLVKSKKDLIEIGERFYTSKRKQFIVATYETLSEEFLEQLGHVENVLIVLDEIHLLFQWGESFREKMLEAFYGLAASDHPILGLTATLTSCELEKLKLGLRSQFQHIYLIDCGNMQLMRNPSKHWSLKSFSRKSYNQIFIYTLKKYPSKKTSLLFCQYRKEVEFYKRMAKHFQLNVLTCLGGEVETFLANLKENPRPELIIATTALSHGVNLPEIDRVFINHHVPQLDFYLQMVGRGGRLGNGFEIYSYNENKNWKDRLRLMWRMWSFQLRFI